MTNGSLAEYLKTNKINNNRHSQGIFFSPSAKLTEGGLRKQKKVKPGSCSLIRAGSRAHPEDLEMGEGRNLQVKSRVTITVCTDAEKPFFICRHSGVEIWVEDHG